ncbi:MAG TPA: TIGR02221 family CRISPR-associated protein [Candidatus Kapabacteria bacterium]|nr:TIGR02221 family CRISPR-associated protein [Ignavibacteria bacterium]HOK14899.1 TIGR02221 family CRISPR-associated protein [Candidatus Kapabacteria bacterium]HOM03950.1 TIGR02221 family CRISPR-associated protein [Candidatus Kapabacteria bacterium]HOQ48521.1 TIGR02221 family CRISPR-associated protein [Candidatus Kapabacteria bacterium]HPP39896.1 TIGR02221 family CRISPR-associated protein [Candidatus Kapabacteria bacterium]
MKNTLFLILGTGQNVLRSIDSRNYRRTKYYLPSSKSDEYVESPFVGEAIIKLSPKKFQEVHIFGTSSSMWETLFVHTIPEETDKEHLLKEFSLIWKSVEDSSIGEKPEVIEALNRRLTDYFEIPTYCHIIEIGENVEQLWSIFNKILHLDIKSSTVSFDITHGLRYQPFFFLFSLFYFNAITNGKVKLGSIYYGALELMNDPKHNGRAPIFEFNLFTELNKWVTAAEVLRKYKDPEQIAQLLKRYKSTEELSKLIEDFSSAFSVNSFTKIIELSKEISQKIDAVKEPPKPFLYVKPIIKEFADEINNGKTNVEKILKVARQQQRNHNYSLAVIAAYEAVIEAFCTQKKIKDKVEANEKLSKLLEKNDDLLVEPINNFKEKLIELKKIRNNIAHLDRKGKFELNKDSIRNLVNFFHDNLLNAKFR